MPDISDSQPQAAADACPAARLHVVTGYDGSQPAARALDAAVDLLQRRQGNIDVVYIAHVPSVDMMSADALTRVEDDFDEIGKKLRASAAAQLGGRRGRVGFPAPGASRDRAVRPAAICPNEPC